MDFNKYYYVEEELVLRELPELILTVGIPGSGKSTWISQYNKDNKYTVISPDAIRKELTGNVSDQSKNAKVWAIAKSRVVKALESNKNVIFDAVNTDGSARRSFIKDLPPCLLKAKVFYVDPEVSKQRIKQDIESGKDRANVPPEYIDKAQRDLMGSINIIGGGKQIDVAKIEDEGFEIIE